jgi:hypothetical protein
MSKMRRGTPHLLAGSMFDGEVVSDSACLGLWANRAEPSSLVTIGVATLAITWRR